MRDKDGWDLTKKQRVAYLEAFKGLYGTQAKPQVGIVPPRLSPADLGLTHEVLKASGRNHVLRGTSKPKPRKEWREQEDIYKWTQTHPRLMWHVMMIGNEGKRNVVQAAVAKRMGLLAGSSDLFIARPVLPYCGLWLEVKQNRSYSMSERKKDSWLRQEMFQERMRDAGYAACFCFGALDGIKKILDYLNTGNETNGNDRPGTGSCTEK